MKRLFMMLVMICTVVLLTACGDDSTSADATSKDKVKAKTIRVGHEATEETAVHLGIQKFADLVNEKSDGELFVEVFANSTMGSNREMLESLQNGTLEAALPTTAPLSSFTNKSLLFDLPYLFKNRESAEHVLDGKIGDQVMEDLEESGFIGLGWLTQGFRHIAVNTSQPVTKPDDLKGIRIRTIDNPIHIAHFEELGASAAPIAFTEVFTAMQQGVVDGLENPYANIDTMGFNEVADYLVETSHIYDAIPILFSKVVWDTLTPEQQTLLKDSAKEASQYQRDLQEEMDGEIRKKYEADPNGIKVSKLSDEERAVFLEKAQPVYDKYEDKVGKELIDDAFEEQKDF
ncbi:MULTISPECIES: TRAP transporter substrate-binding protein [unclassified Sporosarcina]|uniref:TRAP transporter substrate-binding protein n=1 Tax=unclassified Sporosarcina TaxID=2647733 RepID=UPI00203FBD92|nr:MULTISPECIES: TRAP transporter substrate-binding protein [unclassified Sporosarcina]GKV64813.1 ABC transporter substrate-binding protein [Sporosarcina sp. NCCP-2331]GLB54923.1 ABC transporter substrate-binding protein [Sporosarcina sp. NCCP-2378]